MIFFSVYRGKPVALSSSFTSSNANPLSPNSQKVPMTSNGFLHPSHAANAQFQLAHQPGSKLSQQQSMDTENQQQESSGQEQEEDDDEEMEM